MHGRDLWQHLGNPKRMATPLIVAVGQVGQHTGGRGIKKLAARRHVEPRPRCTVFGPKFSGRRFAVRSSLAGRLSRKNGKTNPSQPLPVPLPHRSAKVEDWCKVDQILDLYRAASTASTTLPLPLPLPPPGGTSHSRITLTVEFTRSSKACDALSSTWSATWFMIYSLFGQLNWNSLSIGTHNRRPSTPPAAVQNTASWARRGNRGSGPGRASLPSPLPGRQHRPATGRRCRRPLTESS